MEVQLLRMLNGEGKHPIIRNSSNPWLFSFAREWLGMGWQVSPNPLRKVKQGSHGSHSCDSSNSISSKHKAWLEDSMESRFQSLKISHFSMVAMVKFLATCFIIFSFNVFHEMTAAETSAWLHAMRSWFSSLSKSAGFRFKVQNCGLGFFEIWILGILLKSPSNTPQFIIQFLLGSQTKSFLSVKYLQNHEDIIVLSQILAPILTPPLHDRQGQLQAWYWASSWDPNQQSTSHILEPRLGVSRSKFASVNSSTLIREVLKTRMDDRGLQTCGCFIRLGVEAWLP